MLSRGNVSLITRIRSSSQYMELPGEPRPSEDGSSVQKIMEISWGSCVTFLP